MTHKFTRALLRGMILATLAGFGLMATPGTARADFITFTVNEGAVPGTSGLTFQADKLNGGYVATLTLNPDGTWTETATATFSQYFLAPSTVALTAPEIGDNEPEGYIILGTLQSSGTYQATTCGVFACDIFTFTQQTGSLSIDQNQDGVGDIPLLTASGVGAGSNGILLFSGGASGGTGSFNSNFLTNNLLYPAYWPTLAGLQFVTTINGDVDSLSLPTVRGDVSVQFTAVPEPATLSLLSLGLAAGARFARRRRRAQDA